jgi:outer membrane protein OmpA-like peptidoglycan-associated protein
MSVKKYMSAIIPALLAGVFCPLNAQELNWAQQLVGPLDGSALHHNETVEFGRYNFASGPEDKKEIAKVARLEGKRSAILYKAEGKSSFQVFSVYKNFLKEKGYEILFSCEGKACGESFKTSWYDLNPFESNYGWNNSVPITQSSWESQFYLAAVKKSAAGDVYVSVFTNSGWWSYPTYRVDVAQVSALNTGVVQASKIAEAILAEGRMAFYGITFDTGSSEIKKESEPVLAEIAAFLKTASGASFYVAGHTDDEGDLQANMTLSKARAEAVVKSLAAKGVSPAMLSAHGAGPLSPVAANFTPEGRALNRRVEIVKTLRGSKAAAMIPPALPGEVLSSKPGAPAAPPQNPSQTAQQQAAQSQAQMQAAQQQAAQAQASMQSAVQASLPPPAPAAPPPPPEALQPVPDVKGQLFLTGRKNLEALGFKVKQTGKLIGFIRAQDPAPNTMVKKGSTVTVTVGK